MIRNNRNERKKLAKNMVTCWFSSKMDSQCKHSIEQIPVHEVFISIWPLKSKKGGKDQESFLSSTYLTEDTTRESDKNTIKHHKQEPRGQPFPSR